MMKFMYFISASSSNMTVVDIVHSIYNYILMAGQDLAIRELKSPEEFHRHYLTLMGLTQGCLATKNCNK